MIQPIDRLCAIEYFRDGRPWAVHDVLQPAWSDVEAAIRRMDNFCFPIVQLHRFEDCEDDDSFNLVGSADRLAIFHFTCAWQYVDASRGDARARLWESDQGYECCERNIATDVDKVLRITRSFFDTGSYAGLDQVA